MATMTADGSGAGAAVATSADGDLVARLKDGDDSAFEELVRGHGGRMLAVARRFLPEEDARDAVQDAFLSVTRSIDKFEGNARLSTWLHRIVVNASLMKIRTRTRRPEESIEDLLPRFLADGHMEQPSTPWRESAQHALERDETRRLVRAKIDELPETYRAVLLLRDVEERDTRETADLLGITAANVKVRLHRARQSLRTLLDPHLREAAS
jgi:RNA polymerase sigma-70 factor (ECF subfamily)